MAWRCSLAWQPFRIGSTALPRHSLRCLAIKPLAFSGDGTPDTAQPAPPVPAVLQHQLQNNIISRPRSMSTSPLPVKDGVPQELSPMQLRHAAKMARLSGLAYKEGDDLADLLSKEGFRLVARGQTHFTRWYVADNIEEESPAAPAGQAGDACAATPSNPEAAVRRAPRQRGIMMRGVVWRSGEFNTRLWADMMNFWPAPFEADLTEPREALVAHGGMVDMAEALLQDLRPYLMEAKTVQQDVTFGGHSLGGAFALMMACAARMHLQLSPSRIDCYAFGSPPVLARANKADTRDVLQIVGLSPARIRSFVLDNDPVPRAMLSVDPTFAALKSAAPVSWLLEARARLLGNGATLTPERFLFENVGGVYLIRWSPESGQKVTPLAAAQVEEQLKMAMEEIVRSPATLLQALMDHSHAGYAQELWAAARQLEKQQQAPVGTAR